MDTVFWIVVMSLISFAVLFGVSAWSDYRYEKELRERHDSTGEFFDYFEGSE